MSTNSHDIKFTDDLEREMIQREVDDINDGAGNPAEPLLKWILAIAIFVGTMFIVIFTSH